MNTTVNFHTYFIAGPNNYLIFGLFVVCIGLKRNGLNVNTKTSCCNTGSEGYFCPLSSCYNCLFGKPSIHFQQSVPLKQCVLSGITYSRQSLIYTKRNCTKLFYRCSRPENYQKKVCGENRNQYKLLITSVHTST